MGLKPYLGPTLAALFVCAAYSVLAQTVPAATQNKIPLAVGAGISGYNPDYGQGHLLGGTLWIEYALPHMPSYLSGIGLEAEGRDLNYGRSTTQPANLREDVGEGGVIYSWPRYRNLRPYGKFMMGFGNVDYMGSNLLRYHDSRTITSMGGGVDYRVFRSVWMRADYEYQKWPDMFKATTPPGTLNPQGFTVGAMYHLSHPRSH
jgi:opacity protein-like surface antigen